MPSLLLVSATPMEVAPCLDFLEPYRKNENEFSYGGCDIYFCVTGVGMVNTAFVLGTLSSKAFDLAINAGICGAFHRFSIGEVVRIEEDCFAELGAEDGRNFISVDELGLGKQAIQNRKPYHSRVADRLPLASSITVNKVHGDEESIAQTRRRSTAECESMEGAAFLYAASQNGWNALQLRAVSNMVERRNRESWNIPFAVEKLNLVLKDLIEELSESPLP